MRERHATLAIVLACVLAGAGCGRTSRVVSPQPAVVESSEYRYSLHFSGQDGGFTVTRLEYADGDGIVRQATYQAPVWVQTIKLKPGQRMYLRADITFDSVVTGGPQILGPADFYRGDLIERVDGPGAATVMVDQILK